MDPMEMSEVSLEDLDYLMFAVSDETDVPSKSGIDDLLIQVLHDMGAIPNNDNESIMISNTHVQNTRKRIKETNVRSIEEASLVCSVERKPRQRGESEAARDRRRERNRLLAKESRQKKTMESTNLVKETELLRYQNSMLLQSINEVMSIVQKDLHQSNPIVQAISEVITKAEINMIRDIPTFDAIATHSESESDNNSKESSSALKISNPRENASFVIGSNLARGSEGISSRLQLSSLEERIRAIQERVRQKSNLEQQPPNG